jgi:hypothetical protein
VRLGRGEREEGRRKKEEGTVARGGRFCKNALPGPLPKNSYYWIIVALAFGQVGHVVVTVVIPMRDQA